MTTVMKAKLSFLALLGLTLWGLSQSDQIDPAAQKPEQRQAVERVEETDMEPIPSHQKPKASLVDDALLKKMSFAESSGNPKAKNSYPGATSSGTYGFTNHTFWLMVKRYGKQTGIRMCDKNKPRAQKIMAKLLAEENARSLKKGLSRRPSRGEIYIAHMLGASDALKLINAQGTGQPATQLFSAKVTDMNETVFWDGDRPRTVEEVYDLLDDKMNT